MGRLNLADKPVHLFPLSIRWRHGIRLISLAIQQLSHLGSETFEGERLGD